MHPAPFTVWISGLPAAGKSTLARALARQLLLCGVDAALIASDLVRPPAPDPREEEAVLGYFYRGLVYAGWLLSRQGVPLIFDTPAHLAVYRDHARRRLPRFFEVYVDTPMGICMARDLPRLLRQARLRYAGDRQPFYEIPRRPDLVLDGVGEAPEDGALQVVGALGRLGYLTPQPLVAQAANSVVPPMPGRWPAPYDG